LGYINNENNVWKSKPPIRKFVCGNRHLKTKLGHLKTTNSINVHKFGMRLPVDKKTSWVVLYVSKKITEDGGRPHKKVT